ncbi:MAG TPA: gamma-glutamyltransferase [Opitutus sp.]|nr:gamma-glutamyltransferase [Opitutus sp.]
MKSLRIAVRSLCLLALIVAGSLPLCAQRLAVEGMHGMVVSAQQFGSEAGVEILKRGGNAIDAAVATGFALAVTYPVAGNLGGGGFMLVHLADGRDFAIDYRETAPAAATANMYLSPNGQPIAGPGSSTLGWRASGIPGTVAGLAYAWEHYGSGKISWADIVEPARRLAEEGFPLSQGAVASLRGAARLLEQDSESRRIFLKDGRFYAAGEILRQPELAATLARIQQLGAREFYEGETAARLADAMAAHGGPLTRADLAGYRVMVREPLRGSYRGHEIVTMPPPSSGGIALLQMFAMLEPYDIAALGHRSAARYHLFAEAMRRAFRDRAEYLGDPDVVAVPVARLLDRDYLTRPMTDFDPQHATSSRNLAPGLGPVASLPLPESKETTHFSVTDAAGNAVSNTYTLNGSYGSGVTIPGVGILMNNEMDDFTTAAGRPNAYGLIQGSANAIAPGKRPLSSMTPTFVLKNGRLILVTGSPGGPTIINTVLQVVSNVVDLRMPAMQAVEEPRIHHQWLPDVLTYERYGISADTVAALRTRGHRVEERASYEGAYQGAASTIAVDPETGLQRGAADPRRPDALAVGFDGPAPSAR